MAGFWLVWFGFGLWWVSGVALRDLGFGGLVVFRDLGFWVMRVLGFGLFYGLVSGGFTAWVGVLWVWGLGFRVSRCALRLTGDCVLFVLVGVVLAWFWWRLLVFWV